MNRWKILSIILAIIVIIETGCLVWIYNMGVSIIAAEDSCLNYCINEKNMTSYYDHEAEQCYCIQ